jgi:hypothetical protein
MLASNEADHSRVRRNLSHAFSDKVLREQEQLIMQYVDLLVYRLREHAEAGKPVDMMSWYNYATFDIICDLTFGEPLYCLRDSVEHNWIQTVIDSVQSFGPSSVKRKYPLFDYYDKAINYFADNTTSMRVRLDFLRKSHEKVTNRLEKGTSRPDFFSYVIKNMKNEGKSLSRDEMDSALRHHVPAPQQPRQIRQTRARNPKQIFFRGSYYYRGSQQAKVHDRLSPGRTTPIPTHTYCLPTRRSSWRRSHLRSLHTRRHNCIRISTRYIPLVPQLQEPKQIRPRALVRRRRVQRRCSREFQSVLVWAAELSWEEVSCTPSESNEIVC